MKKNKVLSLFLALTMVVVCAFSGVCEAVAVQGGSNIAQNQGASSVKLSNGKVGSTSKAKGIKSGNYMYYSIENKIYKVNVKTKKLTVIYKGKADEQFYGLTVKDGWIYCTKEKLRKDSDIFTYVFKVKTDGKSAKVLKKGWQPTVYKGNIYYIKQRFDDKTSEKYVYVETLGIYKMSLSGKNDKAIKKASIVEEFIVYKSKIYYTTFGSSTGDFCLYSIPITGGKAKIMIRSDEHFITNLIAYSDYIYFNWDNDQESYNLYKIKTNSTKKIRVASKIDLNCISNGYIYYTTKKGRKDDLYKIKISNNKKTKIKINEEITDELYVEGGYMILEIDYNKPGSKYNAALYLCDTNGKNGKVINTFYAY